MILGGLLTTTFLDMVVVPALFLRYGRRGMLAPADAKQDVLVS